jgi:hypothetical protein
MKEVALRRSLSGYSEDKILMFERFIILLSSFLMGLTLIFEFVSKIFITL